MKNKEKRPPGFMIYESLAKMILNIPNEDAGELIKAASRYSIDGTEYDGDNLLVQTLFIGFKEDIEKNKERYKDICEKRRAAVNKRWAKEKGIAEIEECDDSKNTENTKSNNNTDSNIIKESNKQPPHKYSPGDFIPEGVVPF